MALDLVLRRPHDRTDAPNLLERLGSWHGLQDYMFAAGDFAQGAQKSVFGEKRMISVKRLGLVIQVSVSKERVGQFGSNYQLDDLNLKFEVDNAPEG